MLSAGGMHLIAEASMTQGDFFRILTAGFERQAHHRAETALQAEVDHLPQEFAWRRYKLRLFMPSGTSS